MRVTVHNLGVIKEAEIDLKPLTVFIGPNNAGKTWLAYALAGIFGQYGLEEYKKAYIEEKVLRAYPPLDNAIEQVLDEGNAKIDLIQFADEYGEMYFNDVARLAQDWMADFMGTETSFQGLKVHISLIKTKSHFLQRLLSGSIDEKLSVGLAGQGALLTALKESGKRELYFYTSGNASEKLPPRAFKEFLVGDVFDTFHQTLYSQILTFPAERTTFIRFPHLDISEALLGQKKFITRRMSQQKQRGRSLFIPVSDFLDMMMILFECSLSKREKEAKNITAIAEYTQLAQILERQILRGAVDYSTPEPDPGREIFFRPTERTALEIHIVSSMVKELASLVLYLRYLARPGELLIIDEPEMNLHPEAQAKIIEFLAMLVNAGLHVLVTTHSTYIVDHLANLIEAAEYEDGESIANKFFLQRADAFIAQDDVSVYLVDQGTAKNILDEDGRIDWGTFSAVTDRVESIHFEL